MRQISENGRSFKWFYRRGGRLKKMMKDGRAILARQRFGGYNSLMSNAQFGMIGLGTMGRNFLLNAAEHGFSCIGYDKDTEKQKLLIADAGSLDVRSAADPREFVAGLTQPRNIMLLVPAGPIVDSVI